MTDFLQAHPDGQITQRDHVHYYGVVNLRNGHEVALPTAEMSGQTTASFLRDLLLCYPTQPILLLWDRANWHKGEAVNHVLADHPRLETLFFPPASPHLNPQEHVWSQARAQVSHTHTCSTFQQLKQAFLAFLSSNPFPFDWLNKYVQPILFEF
ncbi:MAG: hypothetical protein DPW16_22380 [Chloroflexi bacterium]|nr:hypothetical protein [Chloroflexota bacterium]